MRKIDIILALITGEATAGLFYILFKDSATGIEFFGLILAILLPILAILGLWLSWVLGKRFLFIFQAAKFLLIGILATLVDLGVLNLLMWLSGTERGLFYSIFKGISFVVATCAKYWGNKFWAFEKREMAGVGKEFTQFFLVTLIGLAINVAIASLVVNTIGPQFGLSEKIWANVGGIIAAIIGSLWNFIGYKFIVFRR